MCATQWVLGKPFERYIMQCINYLKGRRVAVSGTVSCREQLNERPWMARACPGDSHPMPPPSVLSTIKLFIGDMATRSEPG